VYSIAPFSPRWNADLVPTRWLAASIGTLFMAIAEEVGYRSYALRELQLHTGYWTAVLIPTAVFTAAHFAGGVPWQAAVLVVGSTSVLFSVVMLEVRNLSLVAAMHAATNLVQDNLLRPSADASLFVIAVGTGPGEQDQWAVWFAMLAVNVVATGALLGWSRRQRLSAGARH
jgi:membrane protease YdiL (CAAX protease family)